MHVFNVTCSTSVRAHYFRKVNSMWTLFQHPLQISKQKLPGIILQRQNMLSLDYRLGILTVQSKRYSTWWKFLILSQLIIKTKEKSSSVVMTSLRFTSYTFTIFILRFSRALRENKCLVSVSLLSFPSVCYCSMLVFF